MRGVSVRRGLGWAVLVGISCMLPGAVSYSLAQFRLVRSLLETASEARGPLAADDRSNPLSYAGAVRARSKLEKAREAGRLPVSPLARTWHWAREAGRELSLQDRVFMNTPHFPAYVYGNFFFYPAALYVESGGESIVDYASMRTRGRYLPPDQLGTLRPAGFTHAVIARGKGRVSLVRLPQGQSR